MNAEAIDYVAQVEAYNEAVALDLRWNEERILDPVVVTGQRYVGEPVSGRTWYANTPAGFFRSLFAESADIYRNTLPQVYGNAAIRTVEDTGSLAANVGVLAINGAINQSGARLLGVEPIDFVNFSGALGRLDYAEGYGTLGAQGENAVLIGSAVLGVRSTVRLGNEVTSVLGRSVATRTHRVPSSLGSAAADPTRGLPPGYTRAIASQDNLGGTIRAGDTIVVATTANRLSKPLRTKLQSILIEAKARSDAFARSGLRRDGLGGVSGSVTEQDAIRLGIRFVGEGALLSTTRQGTPVLIAGNRQFRFPVPKDSRFSNTGRQANFEQRVGNSGRFTTNIYLDVK